MRCKYSVISLCLLFAFCRIVYLDLSTELAERDILYKPKSVYEPAACACKNLKIFGVSVHLDEFPEQSRTVPQSSDSPHSPPPSPEGGSRSPPLPHSTFDARSFSDEYFTTPSTPGNLLPPIKIATFAGQSEIKLKLKQNIAVPGPKVKCAMRSELAGLFCGVIFTNSVGLVSVIQSVNQPVYWPKPINQLLIFWTTVCWEPYLQIYY